MNFFVTARRWQKGGKHHKASQNDVDVDADAVADGVAGAGPAAISFITYLLKHKIVKAISVAIIKRNLYIENLYRIYTM